jgi:hypothetical protein
MKPRYSVEFKTEGGELIQVWHCGKTISLVEGMRGMLTYSRHPDGSSTFESLSGTWQSRPPFPCLLHWHAVLRLLQCYNASNAAKLPGVPTICRNRTSINRLHLLRQEAFLARPSCVR